MEFGIGKCADNEDIDRIDKDVVPNALQKLKQYRMDRDSHSPQ